jgi:hypothetical protein
MRSMGSIIYWLCMFLMFVFGGWTYRLTWQTNGGPLGVGFLLFIMLILIGIRLFPVSLN